MPAAEDDASPAAATLAFHGLTLPVERLATGQGGASWRRRALPAWQRVVVCGSRPCR